MVLKKCFFILKNNLEHFAFFLTITSERSCIKVVVMVAGKKNTSLRSPGEIHWGHDSMSNTNNKMRGLGLQLKICLTLGMLLKSDMMTCQCINEEQYPIGIKEHIWNFLKSIVMMFVVTANLSQPLGGGWDVMEVTVTILTKWEDRYWNAEQHDFIVCATFLFPVIARELWKWGGEIYQECGVAEGQ